jgi:hypothetical protein
MCHAAYIVTPIVRQHQGPRLGVTREGARLYPDLDDGDELGWSNVRVQSARGIPEAAENEKPQSERGMYN